MKICMKISVAGTFHNLTDGVQAGDIVEVDDGDADAERYIKLGYAEAVEEPREERAVPPKAEQATRPRTQQPKAPKTEKPSSE